MIKGMFTKPENFKMYWKELMHQSVEIGMGSLGIVAVISVFMGAVSAVQTSYQLTSPILPKETIAYIVRDTVILEFAPTLVCIVLAGVIGSKIAGELGNMRVSEQIDALEIMGINTKSYLVMPKILAALITIPLLVILAMVLGIYGGRLAGSLGGILSTDIYDRGLIQQFVAKKCMVRTCQSLHFCIYNKQRFFLLWISCKRRLFGNRKSQYNSSNYKLYSYFIC